MLCQICTRWSRSQRSPDCHPDKIRFSRLALSLFASRNAGVLPGSPRVGQSAHLGLQWWATVQGQRGRPWAEEALTRVLGVTSMRHRAGSAVT